MTVPPIRREERHTDRLHPGDYPQVQAPRQGLHQIGPVRLSEVVKGGAVSFLLLIPSPPPSALLPLFPSTLLRRRLLLFPLLFSFICLWVGCRWEGPLWLIDLLFWFVSSSLRFTH